jgi:hypothetical protein
MQRDRQLLAEIVSAIERILELAARDPSTRIDLDRDRRDTLS